MLPAPRVYAEELYCYGHGLPLWCPEPTKGRDKTIREIELGDVGYVDKEGSFWRFFNITKPAEHEWNKDGGTPEGFIPHDIPDHLKSFMEYRLNPGILSSKTVTRTEIGAGIGISDPSSVVTVDGSGSYRCESNQGAMLCLKDYASKATLKDNQALIEYLVAHHSHWYAFATNVYGIHCRPEDIILVTGTTKTSVWTVVAFLPHQKRSWKGRIMAGIGQIAGVRGALTSERSTHLAPEMRSGPYHSSSQTQPPIGDTAISSRDRPMDTVSITQHFARSAAKENAIHPRTQCIFLSGYRLKPRKAYSPIPSKIIGNADPPFPGGWPDEQENGGVVTSIAQSTYITPHTPTHDLLDYILERSGADIAIANDADLEALFKPQPDTPNDLALILHERKPRILVDRCRAGRLDPRSNCANVIMPEPLLAHSHRRLIQDTAQSAIHEDQDSAFGLDALHSPRTGLMTLESYRPCERCEVLGRFCEPARYNRVSCKQCSKDDSDSKSLLKAMDGRYPTYTMADAANTFAELNIRTTHLDPSSRMSRLIELNRQYMELQDISIRPCSYGYKINAIRFLRLARNEHLLPKTLIEVPQEYEHSVVLDRSPIRFTTKNGAGVRLVEIKDRRVDLLGADDEVIQTISPDGRRMTYRINWPGYPPSLCEKHVKKSTSYINIACDVAEAVEKLVEASQDQPTTQLQWRLGSQGAIKFEQIYLLEVRRDRHSNLVPVLAYNPAHSSLDATSSS